MQSEQRLRHDETQDSVTEKLKAFVVGLWATFCRRPLAQAGGPANDA